MSEASESADQLVKIVLNGTEFVLRIGGEASKSIVAMLWATLKDYENNPTKGKARLGRMLKTGKELKVFTLKAEDMPTFVKEAKGYGILYCVLSKKKDNRLDGMVDIMARAEDASKINRIVDRFHLSKEDFGSIRTETLRSIENAKDGKTTEKPKPIIIQNEESQNSVSKKEQVKDKETIIEEKEETKAIKKDDKETDSPSFTSSVSKESQLEQSSKTLEGKPNEWRLDTNKKRVSIKAKLEDIKGEIVKEKMQEKAKSKPKQKAQTKGKKMPKHLKENSR